MRIGPRSAPSTGHQPTERAVALIPELSTLGDVPNASKAPGVVVALAALRALPTPFTNRVVLCASTHRPSCVTTHRH